MNVCFFSHVSILGGGELWALSAARILARLGHGVSFVCPYPSGLFDACLRDGLDVHTHMAGGGVPFHEPLQRFLRSRDVDVVYCTVVGAFCEAVVLQDHVERLNVERAARGRPPAILVLKTGLPPLDALTPAHYGFGGSAVVRRLHVVAPALVEAFREWLPSTPVTPFVEPRLEGIDLSRYDRATVERAGARAALGLVDGEPTIACVARLHPGKGIDNLLLASAELRQSVPRLRVLVAGEGDDRARLEQLRSHLGLSGCVTLCGQVSDVPALLAAADILCHPSLVDGLPNSVIEAMAMGLPVVASAVGGLPDLLGKGAGVLTPPHDVAALVRELGSLLTTPARAAEVAARGCAGVREHWSIEARTAELADTLEHERDLFVARPTVKSAPVAPAVSAPVPVLFLMSTLRTGGEETEVAHLCKHLDRRRFLPMVVSAHAVDEAAPVRDRLARTGVAVDTRCHELPSIAEKVGYLIQLVRRNGIRVVVACQDTLLAYYLFQHLDPRECRLVEHAGVTGEVYRVPKDLTARCIGVSPAIVAEAAALMSSAAQAVLIPAMVDLADFDGEDREGLRSAWGFGDDVVALFVGRLDAKKSVDVLIAAAARVLPRWPRLRFLIVGGADALQPEVARVWMQDAASLCDRERFAFVGPRGDVPRLLTAADVLVLPGRGEGMSHVISEAGAAGRAVVATDDGAAREQLENGNAGLLVPWGDVDALVAAIEALVANPPLRARLGGRLRARVQREYAAHTLTRRWEALLAEVAALTDVPLRSARVEVFADEALTPFPREIQIETNTACNATCVMCPYPEVTREIPQGRMELALYEKLLDECSGRHELWRIEPFLNNEPFTDTRMVDWIALAKQRVPHAMVTVTTNGSLVFPRVSDRLVQSGLDGIWFSVNGATRETYESIMGLSFDQVMANIDYLLAVRPKSLRVFTNMIETVPMRGEIEENVRRWRGLGVESGSSPLVNRAGNVANFAELSYKPQAPGAVRVCDLLYHKMYVGWNGDVLLCCMDWRRRVVLGNARTQTLESIWNGAAYRRYRRMHEEGRVADLELCRDCSYVRC
jgi:radical SAM protein with 4Fe4S-binding SPASM domain